MGSIDIIKPLSTVLSKAVNKSLQHWINFFQIDSQKKFLECGESNLGLLGEKRECYLCATLHPHPPAPTFSLKRAVGCSQLWTLNRKQEKAFFQKKTVTLDLLLAPILVCVYLPDFFSSLSHFMHTNKLAEPWFSFQLPGAYLINKLQVLSDDFYYHWVYHCCCCSSYWTRHALLPF